ncbi:hypothetical protein ACSRUE_10025 [Sorangium sp. KYC3313]|uniref:hypothetical protein n=1 Tax=Sorangium sp. KYC3313 TaxID=3449740 RepID=UPI003F8AC2AD
MAKVSDLPSRGIKQLGLSPAVRAALTEIQAELADAYRDSFVQMMQTMQSQASALDRIQNTLRILVEHIEPTLVSQLPPAVRVAGDGERPDLASTLVVADPIGAGYTLSQASLAKALGLTTSDVSPLCKSFKLAEDGACAVVVRKGQRAQIVNYHPRAVERFKQLLKDPPTDLDQAGKQALSRVLRKLEPNSTAMSQHGVEATDSGRPSDPGTEDGM